MSQLSDMVATIMNNMLPKDQVMLSGPMLKTGEANHRASIEGQQSRLHRNSASGFDKQYHGPTSIRSLMENIRSSLETIVSAEDEDCMNDGPEGLSDGCIRECMTLMEGLAHSLETEKLSDQHSEDNPLVLPPRRLLDTFINVYFDQINWILPLFSKDVFFENVRRIYALERGASGAWVLCLNGIILLSLNDGVLRSAKKAEGGEGAVLNEMVGADLVKPLHANFKRGLNELQSLLEPSLVNVQALILMVSLCFFEHRCYDAFN